jgi:hypothetical protein
MKYLKYISETLAKTSEKHLKTIASTQYPDKQHMPTTYV